MIQEICKFVVKPRKNLEACKEMLKGIPKTTR